MLFVLISQHHFCHPRWSLFEHVKAQRVSSSNNDTHSGILRFMHINHYLLLLLLFLMCKLKIIRSFIFCDHISVNKSIILVRFMRPEPSQCDTLGLRAATRQKPKQTYFARDQRAVCSGACDWRTRLQTQRQTHITWNKNLKRKKHFKSRAASDRAASTCSLLLTFFTLEETLDTEVGDGEAQHWQLVQLGDDVRRERQQAGQPVQLGVEPVPVPLGRVGLLVGRRRLPAGGHEQTDGQTDGRWVSE